MSGTAADGVAGSGERGWLPNVCAVGAGVGRLARANCAEALSFARPTPTGTEVLRSLLHMATPAIAHIVSAPASGSKAAGSGLCCCPPSPAARRCWQAARYRFCAARAAASAARGARLYPKDKCLYVLDVHLSKELIQFKICCVVRARLGASGAADSPGFCRTKCRILVVN
eukprot:2229012-Pleurochrysis_carterae.AAC.1